MPGCHELPSIVQTRDALGLAFGLGKQGQERACRDGDDGVTTNNSISSMALRTGLNEAWMVFMRKGNALPDILLWSGKLCKTLNGCAGTERKFDFWCCRERNPFPQSLR